MKIKLLIFISIFTFSCKKSNDNYQYNKESVTNKSVDSTLNLQPECDKYNSYLNSISNSEKVNSRISFDVIKCKLFKDINTSKYNYAELLSKYNYKEYSIYLCRLNCNAGGACGDYFVSIINKKFNITDVRIIANEISEGENNITVNDFVFNHGELSFNVLSEYYSEELEDYVESSELKTYLVTSSGNLKVIN